MLYFIIGLFALAAVLGLTLLAKWLSKKDTPKPVVYAHGLAAATGLVLLLVYAYQSPDHYPKASIILFVLAALGGFYLFAKDLSHNRPPVPVAFIHALLAVSGFVALLLFVFS